MKKIITISALFVQFLIITVACYNSYQKKKFDNIGFSAETFYSNELESRFYYP
ncbi:hypothetical protein ACFSKL_07930 [Belliella marina]|uniref:Lipoprotein n=1 Tax=Belliella marina TaxID=1644146 RepID=A0ABW4VJ36_9BACT